MGFLSGLAKIAGIAGAPFTGGLSLIPTALSMGGDLLGSAGKTAANNRGAALSAALQGQQIANQTNQQNINDRQSAWKNLLNTDYVLNNKGYAPATMHSSMGLPDRTLPSFGIARQPFGSGAIQGAQGMQNETLHRLTGGPQLHMPDVAAMSKPSSWEKFLNIAGPGLKFAGGLMKSNDDDEGA